jgi:D-erythronate 2-dehydrogenase
MKVLILGAGGMLGQHLVAALAKSGQVGGQSITKLIRHDILLPPPPPTSDFAIETLLGDFSLGSEATMLADQKADVIFNLASIVSGEAETDFDKGYRINLDGTRLLLDAMRLQKDYRPKFIFTSSIAVFGAPFPDAIEDDYLTTPLTSYGTQKAICELLISDYSRRGFVDGIAMRMPTICVRPGAPNKAASGFFSNIIREPLIGKTANLPVPDTVRHWHASPRAAVQMLLHAANLDFQKLGARRAISMPGVSCTVAEQIEALRAIAGSDVVKLITREPDTFIQKIVAGWPQNFKTDRAIALGFQADQDFEAIIKIHIADQVKH